MIVVHKSGKVSVGRGTTISMFSRIGSMGEIKIGNYVEMGPNVMILDYNHEYKDVTKPIKLQGVRFVPGSNNEPVIEIGDGSWIGAHVSIIGNVRIGKHCVIGANSVVTKSIPDYCVVAGVPCKIIRQYNWNTNSWESVSS